MGDRANVVIKEEHGNGEIYIYTHCGGHDLPLQVQKALAKKWRWDDDAYLTRIIYDEVVKGNERTETGYGISTTMCDNQHKLIVVCPKTQRVNLATGTGETILKHSWTFSEFIDLPKSELMAAYNS